MTPADLREEIAIELEAMEKVVQELSTLGQDVSHRLPTTREKTAGAAFLAQFYTGLENILKRITLFSNISLPEGPNWHIELFHRFASPYPGLPHLFDTALANDLAPYRRFRHVVFHSYSFHLDWDRMIEGISHIPMVFAGIKTSLQTYLQTLEQ